MEEAKGYLDDMFVIVNAKIASNVFIANEFGFIIFCRNFFFDLNYFVWVNGKKM